MGLDKIFSGISTGMKLLNIILPTVVMVEAAFKGQPKAGKKKKPAVKKLLAVAGVEADPKVIDKLIDVSVKVMNEVENTNFVDPPATGVDPETGAHAGETDAKKGA